MVGDADFHSDLMPRKNQPIKKTWSIPSDLIFGPNDSFPMKKFDWWSNTHLTISNSQPKTDKSITYRFFLSIGYLE